MSEMFPHPGKKTIAGIGSALVDVLVKESEDFLSSTRALKGGMVLVDSTEIEETIEKTRNAPQIVPGGSACNTIIGIGRLGGRARFFGKRGRDLRGEQFETQLRHSGVDPRLLLTDSTPTGCVLSIVTPDAQRSMMTHLGAASQTTVEEIRGYELDDAALVHIEGYLLFNEALMMAALETARKAGARVSLDLASYTVVESAKTMLDSIIGDGIDIVIANEDEATAYTGRKEEESALSILAEKAPCAVVKKGKRGSLIAMNGNVWDIPAQVRGDAVDTTGAGDLWAAGFLYGLVNGLPVETCGALASACGCEVCRVMGAQIPQEGWERIRRLL